jgi:protein phosphatase
MIKLRAGFLTDGGRVREENEDSVYAQVLSLQNQSPVGLFVVCDGMGGHMGGKYASYWAVEAIKSEFGDLLAAKDPRATLVLTAKDVKAVQEGKFVPPQPAATDLASLTKTAIQKANKVVFEYSRHKPKQAANAGTTITMMASRADQAVIANVGDSRAYLLRDHDLIQISRDHSLVASLVAEGQITPEEVYTHPRRNMIYRFLGQKGLVQADLFHKQLQPGDYVLLCSDGLWEMLRNKEAIIEIVEGAGEPQAACQSLVEAANQAGGEDNIGVVLVEVS